MAGRAVVAGLENYEDCILYLLAYKPKQRRTREAVFHLWTGALRAFSLAEPVL